MTDNATAPMQPTGALGRLGRISDQNKKIALFISLFSLLFLTPTLDEALEVRGADFARVANILVVIAMLSFTVFVLASAVAVVSDRRRDVITALVLGIPFVLGNLIEVFSGQIVDAETSGLVNGALFVPFGLFTAWCLLRFTFKPTGSVEDRAFAAASAYLLIGGSFGGIYCAIEMWSPGSFADVADSVIDFKTLRYFSFVTITTLGYGDITPRGDVARSVATSEAITGVFLLAFIVARIFSVSGENMAHSGESGEDGKQ